MNNYTTSQTAKYFISVDAVQTMMNQMFQQSQQQHINQSNNDATIGTFSNDQTTVTFNQPNLINIYVFST